MFFVLWCTICCMLTAISDKCGSLVQDIQHTYKGRVFCPTLKKTAFTEKAGISLVEQKTKIFSLHRTVLVSLEYFKIAFTKYNPSFVTVFSEKPNVGSCWLLCLYVNWHLKLYILLSSSLSMCLICLYLPHCQLQFVCPLTLFSGLKMQLICWIKMNVPNLTQQDLPWLSSWRLQQTLPWGLQLGTKSFNLVWV